MLNQKESAHVTLLNPTVGLLLRIACFDAYALASEFVLDDDDFCRRVSEINPEIGYWRHPRFSVATRDARGRVLRPALLPGTYTDDTERALANARVLIDGPVSQDRYEARLQFASLYIDEFQRSGRRQGYARGYQDFLLTTKDGETFLAKIQAGSCKNGAAMGAGVLGVLPTVDEVLRVAALQASVTHNTRCGIFTARVAALATHFALYHSRERVSDLRSYLLDHERELMSEFADELVCGHENLFHGVLGSEWNTGKVITSERMPIGLSTIQAALTLCSRKTMLEALRDCIRIGGDTDSVAAVTASIMAPWHRAERFPDFFERDLEYADPWTGAPRLLEIGGALMKKFL